MKPIAIAFLILALLCAASCGEGPTPAPAPVGGDPTDREVSSSETDDAAPAVWAAEPVAYDEAAMDLKALAQWIDDKTSVDEAIIQYLHLVAHACVNLKAPDAPAGDASEEEKSAHEVSRTQFIKDRDAYRKTAEELFFKAFRLKRVKKTTNQRDAVNACAAKLIGGLGKAYPGKEGEEDRENLSMKLRRATEDLREIQHDLNTDVLAAAFRALADLGSLQSLRWMLREYSHIEQRATHWLVAAHQAMVRFPVDRDAAAKTGRTVVPGTLRYAIVEKFIVTYVGVAWRANLSSNQPLRHKRRLWDNIRQATIPVLQHFAGQPRDPKTGKVLATLPAFQAWFADHRDFQAPPWADAR